MTVSSKIRIYDLAKELKLDTKRLIEEVRREGVDVSVPSNSVSKELAEKIRNKYFPKKETAVKRGVKVVKRAARPVEDVSAGESEEPVPTQEPPVLAQAPAEVSAPAPVNAPKPATTARLVKKLTPAIRAEQPVVRPPPAVMEEPEAAQPEVAIAEAVSAPPQSSLEMAASMTPPSRQVRVLRPTAAAINAGIRPGERAPAPTPPASVTPRERAERTGRLRERTPLARTERLGTPGETLTPQTTYIPPPDSGRRRSRRTPARGGRKIEGRAGRFDKADFIPPPKVLSLEDRIAGRLEAPTIPGELNPRIL